MLKARSYGGVTLILAMLAFALASGPARAATATRTDIFTVSVPLDATAANADAARDQARADGERKAYAALLARLTLPRDRSRLPPPTDTLLNQVVQGFQVANEHHSTVRYLADYTYHFRATAVEQLLRDHGIPFAETVSKPVVVLPVLANSGRPMLWDDPNPWRDAWASAPAPQGLVPVTIPLGEVDDVSAIDAEAADAGDDAHLQAISANYNHADVLVTRATIHHADSGDSVDVSSTRFVPGAPGSEQNWVANYTAAQGESDGDMLARAVAGTVAQVENAWKQANMLDYSQSATLTATIPIVDLNAWLAVRQRLAATPAIQSSELVSLDRHAARVALHYIGSADQLRVALAQNNLALSGSDPDWVLQQGGASAPAAPAPGGATPAAVPSVPPVAAPAPPPQ